MLEGSDGKSRYHEGQSHDGREFPREDHQQAARRRPLSQRALRFTPFSCVLQQTTHPFIHPFIHSFNHSFIVHLSILYHSLLSCCYLRTLSLNRHRLQTVFGGLHGRYLNASLASSTLKAVLLHRIFLLVLSLIRRNLDVIGVRQRPLIGSPQILRDQRHSPASLP